MRLSHDGSRGPRHRDPKLNVPNVRNVFLQLVEFASLSLFYPLSLPSPQSLNPLLPSLSVSYHTLLCHCVAFSLFSLLLISCPRSAMSNEERTFIAIKPDGVQRRLVGEIIKRFELKGFKMVGMKFVQAPESLLREHYADLEDRPFFPGLVSYMTSGPVVAMVWEGFNVVKTGRVMLGETNPADSKPGTIRGDYCIQVGRNIIHGSDSIESANTEINLWFRPEELCSYTSCSTSWLY
uniref:Nucleoside diphosphate kinase n=1 Tax=Oncorhynchus kisutch TaxID=8019 RepID=A0A8C7MW45_ONCKI